MLKSYQLSSIDITPTPSSTVPFLRDKKFVERGKILALIGQILSLPASRVAIVGLGGVG